MKKLFWLAFLFALGNQTMASHLAGGTISYKCLGNRKWEINMVFLRDCLGINLCSGPSGSLTACTVQVTAKPTTRPGLNPAGCSPGSIPQITIILTSYKIEDINKAMVARWPDAKNSCTNNGTINPGTITPAVEAIYYKGILDMSSALFNNVCPYWDVAWSNCCRNVGIMNMQNSSAENFHIAATINLYANQTGCKNNGPVINNLFPSTLGSSVHHKFNFGVYDIDGDSLTYRFAKAKSFNAADVVYQAPYSEVVPFLLSSTQSPHVNYPQPSGPYVILDSLNGDMELNGINNTTNTIFGTLCLEIWQWSKDNNNQPYVVGITVCDFQLYLRKLPPNPNVPQLNLTPNLNSFNQNNKNGIPVFGGDSIIFNLTATDADTVPIAPANTIDSTYFVHWQFSDSANALIYRTNQQLVRDDEITFRYKAPIVSTKRFEYLNVTYADRLDNFRSLQIKFEIQPSLTQTAIINKTWDSCQFVTANTTLIVNPNITIGSYKWEATTQPNNFSNYKNYGTGLTSQKMRFILPGTYIIKLTLTNASAPFVNYYKYDTVEITTPSLKTVFDTAMCLGSTHQMGLPAGNYKWFKMPANAAFDSSTQIAVAALINTNYRVVGQVVGGTYNGCMVNDTSKVIVNSYPITLFPDTVKVCGNAVVFNWNVTSNASFIWENNDTNRFRPITQAGWYKLQVTQNTGCNLNDSFIAITGTLDTVKTMADTSICIGTKFNIKATGVQNYQWHLINANNSLTPIGDSATVNHTIPNGGVQLMVKGYNYYGCYSFDTLTILPKAVATIIKPADTKLCLPGSATFIGIGASSSAGSGFWTSALWPNAIKANTDSLVFFADSLPAVAAHPSLFTWYATYNRTNSIGCTNTDSVKIEIASPPKPFAGNDTTICQKVGSANLITLRNPMPNNGIFYTIPGNVAKSSINFITDLGVTKLRYVVDYAYSNFICTSTDTTQITVLVTPKLTRPAAIKVCDTSSVINLTNFTVVNGGVGTWSYPTTPTALDTSSQVAKLNLDVLPAATATQMGTFWVRYTNTNNGCATSDSAVVYTGLRPMVNAGKDTALCHNQSTFILQNNVSVFPFDNNFYEVGTTTPKVISINPATHKAVSKYYHTNTNAYSQLSCSAVDTVEVKINTLTLAPKPNLFGACDYNQSLVLPAFTASHLGKKYWLYKGEDTRITSSNDTFYFNLINLPKPPANNQGLTEYITYGFNAVGCKLQDSVAFTRYQTPAISGGADKTFCSDFGQVFFANNQTVNPTGGYFTNLNAQTIGSLNTNSALLLPDTNKVLYNNKNYFALATCTSTDTFYYLITRKDTLATFNGNLNPNLATTETYTVNNMPGYTFSWNVTGGTLVSFNNNQATIGWPTTGPANIEVTATNAQCGISVLNKPIQVGFGVGLTEQSNQTNWKVYPNPAKHGFTVSCNNVKDKNVSIELFAANLQLVEKREIQTTANLQEQFNTQHLKAGLYLVKITTNNQTQTIKVVIE